MGSVEEDRQEILEDIKAEEVLEKELRDLETQADRLRAERSRRRALFGGTAPEPSSTVEGVEGQR